jgi:hypothetical protein
VMDAEGAATWDTRAEAEAVARERCERRVL